MKVYRVEMARSGAGPYSPHVHGIPEWEWQVERGLDQMYRDHKDDGWSPEPTHPTPYAEIPDLWMLDWEWNCGFESIPMLEQWFDGWLGELHELGFKLGVYQVPEEYVRFGDYQVIFNKDNATLVSHDQLDLEARLVA